jgi:hypothetical protein
MEEQEALRQQRLAEERENDPRYRVQRGRHNKTAGKIAAAIFMVLVGGGRGDDRGQRSASGNADFRWPH